MSSEIARTPAGSFIYAIGEEEEDLEARLFKGNKRFDSELFNLLEQGKDNPIQEEDSTDALASFYDGIAGVVENEYIRLKSLREGETVKLGEEAELVKIVSDPFLEEEDVLGYCVGLTKLTRPEEEYGEVRFESEGDMSSQDYVDDPLILVSGTHQKLFGGAEQHERELAEMLERVETDQDGLFVDKEFPTKSRSIFGYGVNKSNNTIFNCPVA